MALNLKWSKNAEIKFETINVYLENEWGVSSAKKFTRETLAFLALVLEFPTIGT